MKKLSNPSRIVIAIGAIAMSVLFFVPVWAIYLIAPQYPEGLSMQIWLDKITGQVEIINGLNHYIGMKHIKAEMFPEFNFLIYIAGFYILLGLAIALTGSRKLLLGYLVLSLVGGAAALVDFYMWGYNYGHDLDPTAAIQVPGMSYQPPLIGHKKLLNFDSYSYPDTGGWIVAAVTMLFFLVWFIEWRKNKKPEPKHAEGKIAFAASVALTMMFFLVSCNHDPEKISIGKDSCSECRMTIVDPKFGAEILTKKGRAYKFDDVHCLATFLKNMSVELSEIDQTLFVDYNAPHEFVQIKNVEFVVSSLLKSPMGGNAAAFKNKAGAEKRAADMEGSKTTNWATLYNILIK
jgi:copper chaperone NosL